MAQAGWTQINETISLGIHMLKQLFDNVVDSFSKIHNYFSISKETPFFTPEETRQLEENGCLISEETRFDLPIYKDSTAFKKLCEHWPWFCLKLPRLTYAIGPDANPTTVEGAEVCLEPLIEVFIEIF